MLSNTIEIMIKHQIKQMLVIPEIEFTVEDNLSDLGFGSIRVLQLVVELEQLFDITFEDEDLLCENFSTINKISSCVKDVLNNSS